MKLEKFFYSMGDRFVRQGEAQTAAVLKTKERGKKLSRSEHIKQRTQFPKNS